MLLIILQTVFVFTLFLAVFIVPSPQFFFCNSFSFSNFFHGGNLCTSLVVSILQKDVQRKLVGVRIIISLITHGILQLLKLEGVGGQSILFLALT